MLLSQEIVKQIALDLAEPMRESTDALRRRSDYKTEHNLLDGLTELIDEMKNKAIALNYEEKITLDVYEYWNDIVKAKIELIAVVGGIDLMRRVHSALDDLPDDNNYNYSGHFNSKADGIGGWMM